MVIRMLMFAACGCAVAKESEGKVALAQQVETQTVDQGAWSLKLNFAQPAGDVSTRTISVPPIATHNPDAWMALPFDFDHGPLVSAELTGKLPTTTSATTATTESVSWLDKLSRRFGPGFWGWLALGFGVVGAVALGIKFKVWRFL